MTSQPVEIKVRVLFRRIPPSQRICTYYRCAEKVQRNPDFDKQRRLYHHGCLLDARDEWFSCLDCFSSFDATEASFEEVQRSFNDDFSQRLRPTCPNCGSPNLKGRGMHVAQKHHRMPDGRLVEVSA
jgi:hypothetical protein